ncbi:MAG: ferritin, partial [Phenylobacterium sp.]|nr:ferritin [Phenylobacterium sp.]
ASHPQARPAKGKAAGPEPQGEAWHAAEIAVLEAEGATEAADAARWRLFERTLSPEALRTLLAKLADFEDVVALDRAFEIAAGHGDLMRALAFLMDWPAHREAAALVLKRRAELRGAHNDLPAWAERLSARHPQAALLLVRARALALRSLGAGFSDEVADLIVEAESLAVGLTDDAIPSHVAFLAELR